MTAPGGRGLVILRLVLAGVVVADLLSFYGFLTDARADALARGVPLGAFTDLLSRSLVCVPVILVGLAASIAFAARPARLWEGLLALGALTLLSTAHAQLFGSPWRHLFYSGLCLAGWLLGLAVSRRRGAPMDESYARTGAIALLGAAYCNAGISKLVYGSTDWISAVPIQSVIVGQDGLVADGPLSIYRSWIVNTPAAGIAFSVATVGFELAGPLMLLGRRWRLAVAAGLFAMHANIFVLTAILYWESMLLLAAFGLSPDARSSDTVPATAGAHRPRHRLYAATAAMLALCAVVAIARQARRYARTHQPRPAVREAAFAAPTVPSLQRLGPFAVGQTLADTWSVDSLGLTDDGFVVAVSRQRGRASFELTCASSPHDSPFDLGAAHIFYSSDLELRDFEAAGWQLQAQIREAADGHDICDRVRSWQTAARAGQAR